MVALMAALLALGAGIPARAQEDGPVPMGIIVQPEPHDLEVRIDTDASRYDVNDEVQIRFWVNREAYVYIYNLDASGKVSLIFPNRYQKENRVSAGSHRLPGRGYAFVVRGPEGLEYLQIIATAAPIGFYEARALEREAFPDLGSPGSLERRVRAQLRVVPDRQWAVDWTSYRVGPISPPSPPPWQRRGTLRVQSTPSHAEVYLDGSYQGRTPLTLQLDPGRYRVELLRDGYEPESEWVRIRAGQESRLRVTLERESTWVPAPPPPPPSMPPVSTPPPSPPPPPEPSERPEPYEPIFYGGFDMGLGPDPNDPTRGTVFSFGGELGGPFFGLGFSLRDTGDDVADYYRVDDPWRVGEDTVTLNEGPEAEIYGRFTILRSGPLAIRTGLGIAWQRKAILPTTSIAVVPEDIGYSETHVYGTTLIGAALEYDFGYVWTGYHLRRGMVVGAGFRF